MSREGGCHLNRVVGGGFTEKVICEHSPPRYGMLGKSFTLQDPYNNGNDNNRFSRLNLQPLKFFIHLRLI